MEIKHLNLFIILMVGVAQLCCAQDVDLTANRPFVIEDIEQSGRIHVVQDAKIDQLLQDKIAGVTEREHEQIQGWRVQVFSSNQQMTAKTEANNIKERIRESDIDVEAEVIYNQPFWKVRLGAFRTREEAQLLMDEIIRQMPDLKRETYLVRDLISVAK